MTEKRPRLTRCVVTFKDADKDTVDKLFAVIKALGHSAPIHWFRVVVTETYNELVAQGRITPKN